MVDRFSKKKRSKIMSNIKGKWTAPEIVVHNYLKGNKVKHRMHPSISGNPDALIGAKTVLFIDGCFWHGCPHHGHIPKSNTGYWRPKIYQNVRRDKESVKILKHLGYDVLRVWEHEIKKNPIAVIEKLNFIV